MQRDEEIMDLLSSSESHSVDRGLVMVYRIYGNVLRSSLRSLGASDVDCDDLIQEVLIAVMERFQGNAAKQVSNFKYYLLGIARNKWMSLIRYRKRLPLSDIGDFDIVDGIDEDILEEGRIAVIAKVLEVMPGPCRELLRSFYYEKKSNTEIAEAMGYSNTDTVKSKKYKCLQRLRDLVREKMNA